MFYPAPRELDPDRLAKFSPMYMISRRPAPIDTVGGDTRGEGKYVVTDGAHIMEIFHVQDLAYELGDPSYRQGNHSADMLMAYLPKEKILINADLYSPPQAGARRSLQPRACELCIRTFGSLSSTSRSTSQSTSASAQTKNS